ncbi:MAG: hypothetical protein WBE12_15955, partial [Candidatus Acidiferrum sp.]
VAMFAVFKVPHGLEEQVGWYLLLLPGAIFAAAISELLGKVVPREQALVFKGLLVGFNLIWYFVITYAAVRTYRFVSRLRKYRGV